MTCRPCQDRNKKGTFSDFEIVEIHQKMNNEQDSNTIPDTPSTNKQNSLTKMNRRRLKIETHTTK